MTKLPLDIINEIMEYTTINSIHKTKKFYITADFENPFISKLVQKSIKTFGKDFIDMYLEIIQEELDKLKEKIIHSGKRNKLEIKHYCIYYRSGVYQGFNEYEYPNINPIYEKFLDDGYNNNNRYCYCGNGCYFIKQNY